MENETICLGRNATISLSRCPVLIRCPECRFERTIDADAIPANAMMATCPRCQCRFRFRNPDGTPTAEGAAPAPVPPQQTAPPARPLPLPPDMEGDDPLPPRRGGAPHPRRRRGHAPRGRKAFSRRNAGRKAVRFRRTGKAFLLGTLSKEKERRKPRRVWPRPCTRTKPTSRGRNPGATTRSWPCTRQSCG